MVNYNESKLYKIVPTVEHNEGDIYIGSTTKKYLSDRMALHRCEYRRFKSGISKKCTASIILFDKYGLDCCDIFLIENISVGSKNELHTREGELIKSLKCINKKIPSRTYEQYCKDNRDTIKFKATIKNKRYYAENIEREKMRHIQNRVSNSETIICDCGSVGKKYLMHQHSKSRKHQTYLQNNINEP